MSSSERIHRLAQAVRAFQTAGNPLRERLCKETPHMALEVMVEGLDETLGPWDEAGIASLWSEEAHYLEGAEYPQLVAVVLAGVLPPSHIQAIAYPFLLGAEVIVKHSAADPLFPQLFAEALGERVTVMGRLGLGGVLGRADAVVAVGDDDSVRAVAREVAVATPFLGFGHRSAIELVCGSGMARSPEVAADVARDVAIFDQLGCLSPREILVVGNESDALHFSQLLAQAFESFPERAPLDVAVEGAIRGAREVSSALGLTLFGPDDLQWGVTVAPIGQWTGTPGGRHVIVRAVPGLTDVAEVLAPIKGHLSAVGVAGGNLDPATRRALIRLGASRIVPSGRLQAAPPTWPHDGRRPLASLCRWCGSD